MFPVECSKQIINLPICIDPQYQFSRSFKFQLCQCFPNLVGLTQLVVRKFGYLSKKNEMSWSERTKVDEWHVGEVSELLLGAADACVLGSLGNDGNQFSTFGFKFSELIGIGSRASITGSTTADIPRLRKWLDNADDIVMGYFSYDSKNLLENLTSQNADAIGFPKFHFFIPETVLFVNDNNVACYSHNAKATYNAKRETKDVRIDTSLSSLSKAEYVKTVEKLLEHIQLGDIYEANYCVQHKLENTTLDPFRFYQELQVVSPAPFSCYLAHDGKYLMSSSPERFMMKDGNRLVSQPMKGTNRRTSDNEFQKIALKNDQKERAENVMITDLVRNDLSRSAKRGSIKVDELCGVYEFEHVNQMISTVSAELRNDVHPLDAILNAFPMGSMTGAPKVKAMELIDEYEDFSRGLYSGTVGYFTPNLDFDFNVIIRSVLYNEEKKVVTFPTGSAITINSDPEKEYEECMLKAEAMEKVLRNHAK